MGGLIKTCFVRGFFFSFFFFFVENENLIGFDGVSFGKIDCD